MAKRAKGGNVKTAAAAAKVDIADKSAMVAVPVPNAPAKPKPIKANNIDTALSNLNTEFNVKLKKLNGESSREKLKVTSLGDFEESALVAQSAALREQRQQMLFLHDFQNELQTNTAFREELNDLLKSNKKSELLKFLRGWASQLKKPESQFMQLLLHS